jgi:hypothetical protein
MIAVGEDATVGHHVDHRIGDRPACPRQREPRPTLRPMCGWVRRAAERGRYHPSDSQKSAHGIQHSTPPLHPKTGAMAFKGSRRRPFLVPDVSEEVPAWSATRARAARFETLDVSAFTPSWISALQPSPFRSQLAPWPPPQRGRFAGIPPHAGHQLRRGAGGNPRVTLGAPLADPASAVAAPAGAQPRRRDARFEADDGR